MFAIPNSEVCTAVRSFVHGQCFLCWLRITSAPSPCKRLSRSLSTMSCSDSQLVISSPLVSVGHTYLAANEERVGPPKFSGVSLHTCHALIRPRQTLGNLTFSGCSVLASGSSTPSSSALLDLTRLYSSFRECGLSYGLCDALCTLQSFRSMIVSPPLRLQHSV